MTPALISVGVLARVGTIPEVTSLLKALNALSPTLMQEVAAAAVAFDTDDAVGAIVLTGSGEKAFAAGADIKVMAELSYSEMKKGAIFSKEWATLESVRKPMIAAVNGFALGGGCELAMTCDFILASDTAKFGQVRHRVARARASVAWRHRATPYDRIART